MTATRSAITPAMLDKRDLAAFLRVSQRTIDRLVHEGRLPKPRLGGDRTHRWIRTEIEEAIKQWPRAGE